VAGLRIGLIRTGAYKVFNPMTWTTGAQKEMLVVGFWEDTKIYSAISYSGLSSTLKIYHVSHIIQWNQSGPKQQTLLMPVLFN